MSEAVWISIGFLGQIAFFSRWLVQWIYSERRKKMGVPVAFWYLSLAGGLITLTYAIYRTDPVFITGQAVGAFVYIRNLMLIEKESQPA